MLKSITYFQRRFGALFFAALMTANPEAASAFIATSGTLPPTNPIPAATQWQALAPEPAGGRYGTTTLRVSARLQSLKEQWRARWNRTSAGSTSALYAEGLRAQALQKLVDDGGFIIPKESQTRVVYRPDGTKRESEYFGILSLTLHDPVFQQQLIATKKRYRELLEEVIRERIDQIPPGESSEQTKKELEATQACLLKLDPDAFHLTVAGIRSDTSQYSHRLRFWNLRRQILKRTRDVARFGREIVLLHNGRIRKLVVGTPAIAVELKWQTFKDNLRFIALQDAYAAYFPHKKEVQVPHITLEFILGQWDANLEEWVVTPLQNQCIDEAARRLEMDGQMKIFNKTPLEWRVNQLDVVRSKDLDTPGTEEGPPVNLMSQKTYEAAQHQGEELLLKAWNSVNPNNEPLPWDGVKATLGLFRKYYLHNQRSLLAAIAKGAVSARSVVLLLRRAKKLRVQFKGYSATNGTNPSMTSYRLTAENDRPGLLLAISSVIDQYPGNLEVIKSVKIEDKDPRGAKTAIELKVIGLTEKEAIALWTSLEAIPDLGHRIIGMESLYELGRRIVDRFSGMQVIRLEDFKMDARHRKAGDPSRRTLMLQALLELDARCSVSQFSVERNDGNVVINMWAHVPSSVANRVSSKLRHAAGLTEAPAREIHERSSLYYLYDIPEFLRIVALHMLRVVYPFALRVKLVELLGYAREHDLSLHVMNDLSDMFFTGQSDYILGNNRLAWLRPHIQHFLLSFQPFQNLEGLTLTSKKSDHRFIVNVKFSPWDGSWLLQLKDKNSHRVAGWLRLQYSMDWPVLRIVNDGFSRNSLDVDLMGQLVKELRATRPAAPLWMMVRRIQDLTELIEGPESEPSMSEAELRVALRRHIYERAKNGPVSPSHLSSLVVILQNAGLSPLTLSAVIRDRICLKSAGKETQSNLETDFSPKSSLKDLWNDATLRMPHNDYEMDVRLAETGFEHTFVDYFGRYPPAGLTHEIRVSLKSGELTLERMSVFLEESGPMDEKAEITDTQMINAFNEFLYHRSEVSALQSNWPLQLPDIAELHPLREALASQAINSLQAYWAWMLYETADLPAVTLLRWLSLYEQEVTREAARRALEAQEKSRAKDRLKSAAQFIPAVEYELLQAVAYFPVAGNHYLKKFWASSFLSEIGKALAETPDISIYIRLLGLLIRDKNSALHHALSLEIAHRHRHFTDDAPPTKPQKTPWRMTASVLSAAEKSILQRVRGSALALKRSA